MVTLFGARANSADYEWVQHDVGVQSAARIAEKIEICNRKLIMASVVS